MKLKVMALTLAGAVCLSAFGAAAAAEQNIQVVSTAHLDTVWSWDLETTIGDYIPKTFIENFDLIDKYPDYEFNFEGAYRYQLLKEYYPELFEKLKGYIASGNWNVAGSALENGDVNTPSPEALFRNILYGNNYWDDEFGVRSKDIYLPDCFGFGYALPSIAAHSNLKGFSTQKLSWGHTFGSAGLPFDIGLWTGPDGNSVIANINYNNYTSNFNGGVRNNGDIIGKMNRLGLNKMTALTGFGGDRGGGLYEATVRAVCAEIASNDANNTKIRFASTDDMFVEMTENEKSKLQTYDGEFLMNTHGVGCYTSRVISKRWNRRAELLGDAAERSSVASDWLGMSDYDNKKFEEIWTSVIAHQFHDDITGTSNATIYERSYNDYMVAIKQFAAEYESGVSGVIANMNTQVSAASGVPVVVNNPVAAERTDVVECTVTLDSTLPYVRVFDDTGAEVPAQVISRVANEYEIAFVASVDSMGYRTYEVRPSSIACQLDTGLSVRAGRLSNKKYTVSLDANGDISSIYDKVLEKELLSEPIRLSLFDEGYIYWAAWELRMEDYAEQLGDAYVDMSGETDIRIVERGPARAALEITRTNGGSTYTQTISLSAESQIVRVDNVVDWNEKGKLLKAEFNLAASNATATYDIGLGTIERGNNTNTKAEVPVQKWADVTNTDGSFGVSVINDCKYGMDKYDNNTIRLSLIHTPGNDYSHDSDQYGYDGECGAAGQNVQDIGENRFAYAVYGHSGTYADSDIQIEAEAFNQPMNAFQTVSHDGVLGTNYSFGSISNDKVLVRAVKKAEKSDEIIVRVNEGAGAAQSNVELTLGNGISAVREVYASEESINGASSAKIADGKLVFDIEKFGVKTFALTLNPVSGAAERNASQSIALPFNIDAFSSNEKKTDGGINLVGDCYPSELVPQTIAAAGTAYNMGSMKDGAKNAVASAGQTISLPSGYTTLKILAASTGGDQSASFKVDGKTVTMEIGDYAENIAAWDIESLGLSAYVKNQTPAFVATHRHTNGADNIAATTYMFSYELDITGAATVTLPNNSEIVIFAATAVVDGQNKARVISSLHDEKDRTGNRSNLSASFEGADGFIELATSTGNIKNVSGSKVEISNEQSFSGNSSLKISGNDGSSEQSFVYYDISDEAFTVVPGTILTYKFYAGNELGRYAAIDMRFTYGNPLRDRSDAVTIEGDRVHPDEGRGTVGEWVTVTIDLFKYCPYSVIDAIMFAYDHAEDSGDFLAYVDDLYIGVPDDYLGQMMNEIDSLDRRNYTETSLKAADAAYKLAKTVLDSDLANENDLSYVTENLRKAVAGLVEKRSAFGTIFAPDFNKKKTSAVKLDTENGKPSNLGGIDDESWTLYYGVQFGTLGADKVRVNYSGWNTSENSFIEIRLGDQRGEIIGTVNIPQTSTQQGSADWSIYTWVTADLTRTITGEQDIAIVFRRPEGGNVCNFKYFGFVNSNPRPELERLVGEAEAIDLTGAGEAEVAELELAKAAALEYLADDNSTDDNFVYAYETLESAMKAITDKDVLLGDVTMDGIVNVNDVVALRSMIMRKVQPDANTMKAADMDSNGSLNVSDVVALRMMIINS